MGLGGPSALNSEDLQARVPNSDIPVVSRGNASVLEVCIVPRRDDEVDIRFFVGGKATRLKVLIVRRVLKHPTLKRVRLVFTRCFRACSYEAFNNPGIFRAEKIIDCCGDLSILYCESYDGIPKDGIRADYLNKPESLEWVIRESPIKIA
jgi:hypothetical protein